MSASKIFTALSSSSDITNLVNQRIELAPATQGIATPFITYEYQGEDPIKDLNGQTNLVMQDWQITAVSNNNFSAETVKDAIIKAMDQQKILFRSYMQGADYEYDENAEMHKFILDFTISYNR